MSDTRRTTAQQQWGPVVATAPGSIRQDLGASIEELEWTVNAYNLSFAVLVTGASLGVGWGVVRGAVAGTAAGFLLTAALFGAVFFMAQFLQVVLGSSLVVCGVLSVLGAIAGLAIVARRAVPEAVPVVAEPAATGRG